MLETCWSESCSGSLCGWKTGLNGVHGGVGCNVWCCSVATDGLGGGGWLTHAQVLASCLDDVTVD
jgi:hypothetical protein